MTIREQKCEESPVNPQLRKGGNHRVGRTDSQILRITNPRESFLPLPFFSHSCWNPPSSVSPSLYTAAPASAPVAPVPRPLRRCLSWAAFIANLDGCRPPGITMTFPPAELTGVIRPLELPCFGKPRFRRCRRVRRAVVAVVVVVLEVC